MPRPNAVLSQSLHRVESFTHRIDTVTALHRISWQATVERLFLRVPSELFSKEGGEKRKGGRRLHARQLIRSINQRRAVPISWGCWQRWSEPIIAHRGRARGYFTKGRIRAKLGSNVASMLDDGDGEGEGGVGGRRTQGSTVAAWCDLGYGGL